MSDYVTDEMVEAAARASFRDGFMRHAPEHENRELTDYDDEIRESWRVVARAALEAVAPALATTALRDAADWLDDMARGQRGTPYLLAGRDLIARLRARADQMEAPTLTESAVLHLAAWRINRATDVEVGCDE